MVQTSVQFTPVQVLQAARRAEAEGKMDYALQFYRHLVEQHGTTPEAQEAREGLFRIAEWRWGEARVARSREAGGAGATPPQNSPPAQPPQSPPQWGDGTARLQRRQHPAAAATVELLSGTAAVRRRDGEVAASSRASMTRRAKTCRRSAHASRSPSSRPLCSARSAGLRSSLASAGRPRALGGILCSAVDTGPARTAVWRSARRPGRGARARPRRRWPAGYRGVREHQRAARARCHRARPHELLSAALAQPRVSFRRGMISTRLQGRWRLSSCHLRMPFHASLQAPGDPGRQKT